MSQREVIEILSSVNTETQESIYSELRKSGLTESDIDTIKSCVFYHKLYNDTYLYNTTVKAMGEEIYKELNA